MKSDFVIKVDHLQKQYKINKKELGLTGSLKSFFAPKSEIVRAVDDISFSITEGELVGFIGPNSNGSTPDRYLQRTLAGNFNFCHSSWHYGNFSVKGYNGDIIYTIRCYLYFDRPGFVLCKY